MILDLTKKYSMNEYVKIFPICSFCPLCKNKMIYYDYERMCKNCKLIFNLYKNSIYITLFYHKFVPPMKEIKLMIWDESRISIDLGLITEIKKLNLDMAKINLFDLRDIVHKYKILL
jgi:hypothetical protein